jgi:hypothetical protein
MRNDVFKKGNKIAERCTKRVKFLTLVISQRHVSQFKNDVSLIMDNMFLFTTSFKFFGSGIFVTEIQKLSTNFT